MKTTAAIMKKNSNNIDGNSYSKNKKRKLKKKTEKAKGTPVKG